MEASINTDPQKNEELWTPVVNIWFKKEKKDPTYPSSKSNPLVPILGR
jgi:general stress protein 26